MYRAIANFKLQAQIYRYHIAAGAFSYIALPGLPVFLKMKKTIDEASEERIMMIQNGAIK